MKTAGNVCLGKFSEIAGMGHIDLILKSQASCHLLEFLVGVLTLVLIDLAIPKLYVLCTSEIP